MRHRLARLLSIAGCALVLTGLASAPAPAHPEGFHVLLFSKTAAGAYRHDSIPAGIAMFEQLAAQHEWELTRSEDSAILNDAALATFDVVVNQYDPDNPSPTKFPAYFDQTPFFGEWSRNRVWEFRVGQDGKLLKINDFLSNLGFKSPLDVKFGPDGAMYLLEWGSGYGRDNPDSGLHRIDYRSGDRSPVATATGTPTSGSSPLAVRFSSAGSGDPGGRPGDLPVGVR